MGQGGVDAFISDPISAQGRAEGPKTLMDERREHQQRQERQDLLLLSRDREGWFLISQIAFIALIFVRGWKQHLYLQGGEFALFSLGAVSGDSVAGDSDKPRGLCRAGIYCSLLQSHKSTVNKQSPSHPIPACAGGFLERGDVFPREQRAVEDGQQGPAQERRGAGAAAGEERHLVPLVSVQLSHCTEAESVGGYFWQIIYSTKMQH